MVTTRRVFLLRSLGTFGAAMLGVQRFGLLDVEKDAQQRAILSGLSKSGGNDSGNLIIPYDNHPYYFAARSPSGLAIEPSNLLRTGIVPSVGAEFGFHPSLGRPSRVMGPEQACSRLQRRNSGRADESRRLSKPDRATAAQPLLSFRPNQTIADVSLG